MRGFKARRTIIQKLGQQWVQGIAAEIFRESVNVRFERRGEQRQRGYHHQWHCKPRNWYRRDHHDDDFRGGRGRYGQAA